MSTSVKIGLSLYGLWFLGLLWMFATSHYIDQGTKKLYLVLPVLAPLVAIGFLQVLVWIGQALGKIDH